MPERRFPPPWSAEEQDACFVVRDNNRETKRTVLPTLGEAKRSVDFCCDAAEAKRSLWVHF